MNNKHSFILGSILGTIITTVVFATVISPAVAHSGGTDANGGHYNRKTGEYHYHNGGKSKGSSGGNNQSGWLPESPSQDAQPSRENPRTTVLSSYKSGKCTIRLASDDSVDSGELEILGVKYQGNPETVYTVFYSVKEDDETHMNGFTMTKDEVLQFLMELCDILTEINKESQ